MKSNFIVKNGERQTGEMSVFEAVEVAANFKALSTEEDKIEIHSFCRHWALKKNGKINQVIIYDSKKEADEKWWEIKPDNFDCSLEVVEVRQFTVWYRKHDEKDYKHYYTDVLNLEDAVSEVLKENRGLKIFAIDYDGEVISRYGSNYILNPENRK